MPQADPQEISHAARLAAEPAGQHECHSRDIRRAFRVYFPGRAPRGIECLVTVPLPGDRERAPVVSGRAQHWPRIGLPPARRQRQRAHPAARHVRVCPDPFAGTGAGRGVAQHGVRAVERDADIGCDRHERGQERVAGRGAAGRTAGGWQDLSELEQRGVTRGDAPCHASACGFDAACPGLVEVRGERGRGRLHEGAEPGGGVPRGEHGRCGS